MLKKTVTHFLCAALILNFFVPTAYCFEVPSVSASAAVLITADTKEILYSKSPHEQRPVASTTKIMTALLAVEYGELQKIAVADDASVNVEGTSVGLKAGDAVSLETLILAMLLESGNDAANLSARAIAGSVEDFCTLMNEKAQALGMKNTHFSNPSGLPCDSHFSTAYDMALLGAFAINNPLFAEFCSLKTAVVTFGTPAITRTFKNHNRLLSEYEGAFGIKTGFTKAAGRCLVSAAKKDGITLVAVTLNAPDDWNDHKKLYDYGFKCVKKSPLISDGVFLLEVAGSEKQKIKARACPAFYTSSNPSEYRVLLLKEKTLFAPVKTGDIVGKLVLKDSLGETVFYSNVIACEEAPAQLQIGKDIAKKQSFLEKIISYIKGFF